MSEDAEHRRIEILWRLYEDDRVFARHHETQRTHGSGLVIAVSAGLIGFISLDNTVNYADLSSVCMLILLGLFGIIFTQKHYERSRLHLYRAYEYYYEIERSVENLNLEILRRRANEQPRARFGILADLKLSWLWMFLHGVISLSGTIMAYLILSR